MAAPTDTVARPRCGETTVGFSATPNGSRPTAEVDAGNESAPVPPHERSVMEKFINNLWLALSAWPT